MLDDTTVLLDRHLNIDHEPDHEVTAHSSGERCELIERNEVVEQSAGFIDEPHDPTEQQRYRHVKAALVAGNGFAAAEYLVTAPDSFGGPYQLLPCYCLALVAVEACRVAGVRILGDDHLLRTIRAQSRNELARLPAHGTVEWIIPATPADRTAAHVAALLSARLGTIARPWLWPMIPAYGRFTVLGSTNTVNVWSDHHRCHGHSTFHAIAERLHQIA